MWKSVFVFFIIKNQYGLVKTSRIDIKTLRRIKRYRYRYKDTTGVKSFLKKHNYNIISLKGKEKYINIGLRMTVNMGRRKCGAEWKANKITVEMWIP